MCVKQRALHARHEGNAWRHAAFASDGRLMVHKFWGHTDMDDELLHTDEDDLIIRTAYL